MELVSPWKPSPVSQPRSPRLFVSLAATDVPGAQRVRTPKPQPRFYSGTGTLPTCFPGDRALPTESPPRPPALGPLHVGTQLPGRAPANAAPRTVCPSGEVAAGTGPRCSAQHRSAAGTLLQAPPEGGIRAPNTPAIPLARVSLTWCRLLGDVSSCGALRAVPAPQGPLPAPSALPSSQKGHPRQGHRQQPAGRCLREVPAIPGWGRGRCAPASSGASSTPEGTTLPLQTPSSG